MSLERTLSMLNKDEALSPRPRYLAYIFLHKLYVYQEGRKLGLGRLRMLLHDWQKLTPAEFAPYCATFYGTEQERKFFAPLFDKAWLHHQRSGSAHHWQSHLLQRDDGSLEALDMPLDDRREMVADWRGMGRMFGEDPPAVGWYEKNKDKMILHPNTRHWVENKLGVA